MSENILQPNQLFILARPIVSIFHNSTNMYSIARVKIQETNIPYDDKEIVVVGYFPKLAEDVLYRFTGMLKNHPKYGVQFQVQSFEKEIPSTEQGVIHYLSSDLFPGIGRKTAETIVKKLGNDAIKVIMNNPDVLDDIPRLPKDKKNTIIKSLQENVGLDQIMIQLKEWGFGPQLSMKIYQMYREDTVQLLKENPYRLIEDVDGVGFNRADELGAKLGITGNHPDRIKACILQVLNTGALSDGHVYLEGEYVLPKVKEVLENSQPFEISYEDISNCLMEMEEESKICGEERRIYLPSLYFSEVGIASKLIKLLQQKSSKTFTPEEIKGAIEKVEDSFEITYAKSQYKAIECAINSPVMILTGGPGTGKTTVIKGLVEVFADLHDLPLDPKIYAKNEEPYPIVLVAPTGRAAKRLSESTELPAMTIHRLLGITGQEKDEDAEREVDCKLIIIDEMSMVDTWLAHQLLKCLKDDVQVVFVGDEDQLPPVGPGQVLKDLLASKEIPTVALTDIYRQSEGSTIIELAHQIKQGEIPTTLMAKTSDRSFIKASAYQISDLVTQIVQNAMNKGQSIRDIQVLAPMYKGPAGIDNLNKKIQEVVNPNSDGSRKEIAFGDVTYRIGDKVLQLVNQSDSNVFNGDIGEVISIFKAKETTEKQDMLVVSFDGNEVTYTRNELNQITLAYCCSIHKSQGSEFQTVIMPVVQSYAHMLRKNLLYTGITRAKNYLILCGEQEAFLNGIRRNDDEKRLTTLKYRLNPTLLEENSEKQEQEDELTVQPQVPNNVIEIDFTKQKETILTMDNYQSIDPMIGMDGISPLDFLDEK